MCTGTSSRASWPALEVQLFEAISFDFYDSLSQHDIMFLTSIPDGPLSSCSHSISGVPDQSGMNSRRAFFCHPGGFAANRAASARTGFVELTNTRQMCRKATSESPNHHQKPTGMLRKNYQDATKCYHRLVASQNCVWPQIQRKTRSASRKTTGKVCKKLPNATMATLRADVTLRTLRFAFFRSFLSFPDTSACLCP